MTGYTTIDLHFVTGVQHSKVWLYFPTLTTPSHVIYRQGEVNFHGRRALTANYVHLYTTHYRLPIDDAILQPQLLELQASRPLRSSAGKPVIEPLAVLISKNPNTDPSYRGPAPPDLVAHVYSCVFVRFNSSGEPHYTTAPLMTFSTPWADATQDGMIWRPY